MVLSTSYLRSVPGNVLDLDMYISLLILYFCLGEELKLFMKEIFSYLVCATKVSDGSAGILKQMFIICLE